MRVIQQRKVGILSAVLAAGLLGGPFPLPVARAQSAPPGNITTWSVQVNTPDWNKNLGVTATRQGCSSSPTNCVNLVRKVSQASNVRATLAVPLNTTNTADNALQFSQMSLNAPFLVEVGIDDFVSRCRALFPNSIARTCSSTIAKMARTSTNRCSRRSRSFRTR